MAKLPWSSREMMKSKLRQLQEGWRRTRFNIMVRFIHWENLLLLFKETGQTKHPEESFLGFLQPLIKGNNTRET